MKLLVIFVLVYAIAEVHSDDDCIECSEESEYLGLNSLAKSSINPCEDFGAFVKKGWEQNHPKPVQVELLEMMFDRSEDILDRSGEDDGRLGAAMRSVYNGCLGSARNFRQTFEELVDYLRTLGSSPIISGSSWDSNDFSLERIFAHQPKIALKAFLNREVQLCDDLDGLRKIVCLQDVPLVNKNRPHPEIMEEIFGDDALKGDEIVTRRNETRMMMKRFEEGFAQALSSSPKGELYTRVPVSDLHNLFPDSEINWVNAINTLSGTITLINDDDSVLIRNYEVVKQIAKFLNQSEKNILADYFTSRFIYEHRTIFGKHDKKLTTDETKICFSDLYQGFPQFFTPWYYHTYHDKRSKLEAESFIKDAAASVGKFLETKAELSNEMKNLLKEKLETLKISNSFQELSRNNITGLNELMKENEISGDERLFTLTNKLNKLKLKIPRNGAFLNYDVITNYLNIPSISSTTWFDMKHSRFLTTATFHVKMVGIILTGVETYFEKRGIELPSVDIVQVGYESYKSWLAKGNRDTKLDQFSHDQLFWISVGVDAVATEEYSVAKNLTTKNDFMNLKFKKNQGFQEAFNCQLNDEETKKLQECGDHCRRKFGWKEFLNSIDLFLALE